MDFFLYIQNVQTENIQAQISAQSSRGFLIQHPHLRGFNNQPGLLLQESPDTARREKKMIRLKSIEFESSTMEMKFSVGSNLELAVGAYTEIYTFKQQSGWLSRYCSALSRLNGTHSSMTRISFD